MNLNVGKAASKLESLSDFSLTAPAPAKKVPIKISHYRIAPYDVFREQCWRRRGLPTRLQHCSRNMLMFQSDFSKKNRLTFNNPWTISKLLSSPSPKTAWFPFIQRHTVFTAFRRRLWVIDTQVTKHVLILLGANILGFCFWKLFLRFNPKKEEVLEKHFAVSLDNIMSGRIHTIVSSAFCHNGNGWNFFTNCSALLFFGGGIARSVGTWTFYALYGGFHLLWTGASLLINYLQYRRIGAISLNLKNNNKDALEWIRNEKVLLGRAIRKEGLSNGARPEAIERAQRTLIRMSNEEFLATATDRYLTRMVPSIGGCLGFALYLPFLHTASCVYIPFTKIRLPVAIVSLVLAYSFILSNPTYAQIEFVSSLGLFTPIVLMSGYLMKRRAIRPVLTTHVEETPTKGISLKKAAIPNEALAPTPEQIEKMRKQNEKFRLRRLKRSQRQESQSILQ